MAGRDCLRRANCYCHQRHIPIIESPHPSPQTFLHLARRKFESKVADPGATVGAYGAQSIGEPGTQMTLKVIGIL